MVMMGEEEGGVALVRVRCLAMWDVISCVIGGSVGRKTGKKKKEIQRKVHRQAKK